MTTTWAPFTLDVERAISAGPVQEPDGSDVTIVGTDGLAPIWQEMEADARAQAAALVDHFDLVDLQHHHLHGTQHKAEQVTRLRLIVTVAPASA